jgi:hypothetical protein
MHFNNKTTRNVAEAVAKILSGQTVSEELKGDQHKIDKNKNNKIDAHDFKILRGEKKVHEEKEESCEDEAKEEVKKHEKKHHGKDGEVSKHVDKMHKEDVEQLDEYNAKDGRYVHKGSYGTAKGAEYGETDYDKENKMEKELNKKTPARKGYGARQNYVRSYMKKEDVMAFSDLIESYKKDGLKAITKMKKEEVDSETYKKEMQDQKDKFDGKKKGGDVAKASVQAVKIEEDVKLDERSLTEPETKKKEEVVKSMKKNLAGFKDRYGDRAKEVMYATATKIAKKKE